MRAIRSSFDLRIVSRIPRVVTGGKLMSRLGFAIAFCSLITSHSESVPARGFNSFKVTNELKTEAEVRDALEKL